MWIQVREIPFGSTEHALTIRLRSKVLREPLGLEFSPEQLAAESGSFHLGAFSGAGSGNELRGCLVLAPRSERVLQMRQVAVDPEFQGSGIGRQLVGEAEAFARARGFAEMMLHARETAVPFYRRLGYAEVGEPFVEIGLPHREMRKPLL
jgi:ribosomal protein S18 acetylase RimI-like enzyme